jgi:BMFP domain-containing protein YqiC
MVTQDETDPDFPFDDEPEHRRRKERVLHTRISEQLSEDIRRASEDLRVPVSNLVRNVLEEAFGAVERVSDEVGEFLEEVLGDAEGARKDLRRLRRRVQHLARRQRHRFRRRGFAGSDEAPVAAGDEELGEPEAFGSSGEDRLETEERELPPAAPAVPPAPPVPPRAFPEVLGWQPLLLNGAAPCAGCDRPLAAGERVFVGATERGLSRSFLCDACMRERGGA